MATGQPPDQQGPILVLVMLALAGFLAVTAGLGGRFEESPEPVVPRPSVPDEGPDREQGEQRRTATGDGGCAAGARRLTWTAPAVDMAP
jgi:hypothetical protein